MENIKAIERAGGIRMAGEERRQQIINIAIRLFSQRGFRGTTTKEIAHAAGVSEAIIFRHFATKHDLYAAILDSKACIAMMSDKAKLIANATKRGDDEAMFAAMAREMLKHHSQDFDFYRLLLFSALEGHEISQMFRERYVRQNCELMDELVRERQRVGAIRDLDPMLIARAFFGMIMHHSLVNLLFDPSRTFLEISDEAAAQEFAGILMRGIGAKKSKDVSDEVEQGRAKSPPARKSNKSKLAASRAKKQKVNKF
ncbi:MAG: hypothetical protein NVSMB56_19240 [Pyrinomonadaceae bacterium]